VKRRAKGEGSLYCDEKNRRWLAQITLPIGRRRTESGKSQKEVMNWLIKQQNKVQEGLFVLDDRYTNLF